jgi:eukaryotic-like serine/threonine-protein kinase
MNLAAGTHLGPYEIVSRIGAGGMGEVWRARDSRIGREVAIKVLPIAVATDAERLRRFQQEARTAGTLNHPNLVTIFELGTEDGAPYIVMELLEGETLRERIGSDSTPRIPLRKTVDLSMQIASGLAAAHEKQIVHRDLKPENIYITRDGRVKLLDFGLAKLTASGDTAESLTQQRDTAPGTVVGTAGYMSPEQVLGHDVDHRTDIFAFGAILYEMLTGRRAFRRDSSVETMHAILTEDPAETSASGHHVSPVLDRIVRRCLEKNREERFQSARDLVFAVDAMGASGSASDIAASVYAPQSATRRHLPWIAAGVALFVIAAVSAAYVIGKRNARVPLSPRFTQLTFSLGIEGDPAISPNAETFVFVREGDIYMQRVDGRNAINLTNSADVREGAPKFSPDGRMIAFHRIPEGGIFVMGATGESVRRITSVGFDPAWSPDGKRLVYSERERTRDPRGRTSVVSPLWIVDVADGNAAKIYDGDAMQPNWSPNGHRIVFWAMDEAALRNVHTISAEGGDATVVPVTSGDSLDWNPVWSPDGHWIYYASDRNGTMALSRIGIEEKSGRPRGTPEAITVPASWAGGISVAANGRHLVFQSVNVTDSLYRGRVDRQNGSVTIDETPLLAGSLKIRSASTSPDGEWIAFTTAEPEDVFLMRSDGSDIRQLTADPHRDRGPTWTRDGERIVFFSSRGGTYQIWSIRPDGSDLTQMTALPDDRGPVLPLFSPDGKKMVMMLPAVRALGGRETHFADTARLPVSETEPLPSLPDVRSFFSAQAWSPDGTLLAGTEWAPSENIYVYSIAAKSYRKIAPGSRAHFIDDERLLIQSPAGYSIAHLTTGEILFVSDAKPRMTSAAGSYEHLVMVLSHTEADIWMATLGEN